MKDKYEDYTEQEFLQFITALYQGEAVDEQQDDAWVRHFEKVTEHPRQSDLLYWPLPEEDNTPQGILNTVKTWRAANGKPGFKPA